MPGSGKSLVAKIAMEMGFSVVVMGDVIREETERRGLKITPENMGAVMLRLREEYGATVVAERCVSKIRAVTGSKVLVDGVRSIIEVDEFRRHFPDFILVAIHSSPETRFQRIYRRRRTDDPQSWREFMERDLRELQVGVGAAIAMADYMLINETTPTQLRKAVEKLLRKVI
ncbi:flagellar hook-basal body complex protein FliE [Candidatus Bathyarchaeota archaeon]|nr:flagellar hook-basal body complex protein FliE [Candidatus Bathyarchaeota archaeon]